MEVQSLPTTCTSSPLFTFPCESLSHSKPVSLPDIQDFSSPPDCTQSSVSTAMAITETEENDSRMETDSSAEEAELEPEPEKEAEEDQRPESQPEQQLMNIPALIPAPVTLQDETQQKCAVEADTGITPMAPGDEDLGPVPDLVPDSEVSSNGKASPTHRGNKRKRTLEDIVRRIKHDEPTAEDDDSDDTFNEEEMLARLDKSPGSEEPSELDSSMSQSGEVPLGLHIAKENGASISMSEKQANMALLHHITNQNHLLASMKEENTLNPYHLTPGVFSPQVPNSWFPPTALNMNGLAATPFLASHMDQSALASKFFPMLGNPFGAAAEPEKDYLKCQYCERTFRRQKNLENHIENAHQGKSHGRRRHDGQQGDMYFKCTHCPYTTKHQSNLYVHLRIHTGERPYICGACGVQYSQSHSLKSHIINKHDGIMTYYIKEKRTRSPRGLGYLTAPLPQEMRFPMPANPLLTPNIHQSPDLPTRAVEPTRTPNEPTVLKQEQPTPVRLQNGHAGSRHPSGGDKPLTPVQQTPNNWRRELLRNNPKEEVHFESSEAAMDLSKKTIKNSAHFEEELQKTMALCHGNNNNCNHSWKLKALRRNVLRMLSILVPNLNFEEKGINAEGDSIDELLQDVIESNTQEPTVDE